MVIPEKFTINGQTVQIKIVDTLPGGLYGQYKSALETIEIAKYIRTDYGLIKPSDYQTLNTCIHEIWHVYQSHYKGEFDEQEACTVAGFLTEFLQSCNVDMELNNKLNDVPIEITDGYEKMVQELEEETFDSESKEIVLS